MVCVHRKPGGGEEVGDCQLALSPTTIKGERVAERRQSALGVERERWLSFLAVEGGGERVDCCGVGVALVVVLVLSSWLSELIVLP